MSDRYMVCVEFYSAQFDDPSYIVMDDVRSLFDIFRKIDEAFSSATMVDFYIDVYDSDNPVFQESYSVMGCMDSAELKQFVCRVWPLCERYLLSNLRFDDK